MKFYQSDFYKIMETISNFFILNILWLLSCIPIITIFPATSALFSVARQWQLKKERSVYSAYLHAFRKNFLQSLGACLIWFLILLILAADYYLVFRSGIMDAFVFKTIFFLFSTIFTMTSLYLFPVLVHYKTSTISIFKNSLLLAVSQLHMTILLFLLAGLAGTVLYLFPFLLLALPSCTAYAIYYLCRRVFQKIERYQQQETAL
ncbi:DUF624 domain-containing protein [Bacillus lacus]|uniref:DUF624 domain-containing protein n=1 Tax=Metabacillus lacus TaxID=1983721 RepID=A0A7X2J2D0_9BACI|nr:DUF624 domain-containing protein [Metabacillus lacus]MRX74100.1 DUF624 domain-containing protein [Metabacillus lacus]